MTTKKLISSIDRTVVSLSAALFLSAFLLFWLQPMVGKMLLPHLGGSPAVWNTCLVFFQAIYLVATIWVFASARWLSPAAEKVGYGVIWLLPFLVLPASRILNDVNSVPVDHNPTGWLFLRLLIWVGPPLFALSTASSSFQRRFSLSSHPRANDPYFLRVSSNLGSLAAVLLYPFVLEGQLGLMQQSRTWAFGYAFLGATVGFVMWFLAKLSGMPGAKTEEIISGPQAKGQVFWWVLLAFVPSSLLAGVTFYLSELNAPIPLLWVLALALYLLSLVVAFSTIAGRIHFFVRVSALFFMGLWIFLYARGVTYGIWASLGANLGLFFTLAIACHTDLVKLRPRVNQLTWFYVAMSVGGVLGGMFNAMVAPLIFLHQWEYPISVLAGSLLLIRSFSFEPKSWMIHLRLVAGGTSVAVLFLLFISHSTSTLYVARNFLALPAWKKTTKTGIFYFTMLSWNLYKT